jgi:hypothetical protein
VFRDAVASAGHAENGSCALQFYDKMGKEIDQACEDGRLDCRPRLTGLTPPWHREYNALLLPTFFSVLKRLITFRDFSASTDRMMSFGPGDIMVTYETVTREKLLTSRRARLKADPEYHRRLNRNKIKVLNKIGTVYQTTAPALFLLALLTFSFLIMRCAIKRRCSIFTVLSGAALSGLFSIVFILTVLTITSYDEIERSLHSAYPVFLFFIMMVLLDVTSGTFSLRQEKING